MPDVNNNNLFEKYFNRITRYHIYFLFFMFVFKIPVVWHLLSLIFLSPPMKFYCKNLSSNSSGQCPCDNPVWDRSVFTETMQTKYNIICDEEWLVSFSQSMLYVGTLLGSFSFGFMADKYGRLPMFSSSCLLIAISGFLVSVMPTTTTYIFMRCIEGIGIGGAIVTGYVLCVEYCGNSYRDVVSSLYHIPVNLSHISLAGISHLLRNCDELQVAISIPVLLCASLYFVLMESPKWLVHIGDVDKAEAVLTKIARFNKKPTDSIRQELEEFMAHLHSKKSRTNVKFCHIFRHRRLTLNLMCMSFIYFVCGMGYYGVSQYIGKMSGNIHTNVAISGALLLPGTVICTILLTFVGRRSLLIATNFFSGLFMIAVICIPSHLAWVRVIVACICNSAFFMSFIIVFLYGVELFPTSIRNSVLGFLSVLSRVGQIVAPPINALSETISGTIFSVMAIIAGILVFPLPETKNIELPSSLEDSKMLGVMRPNNVNIDISQ